MWIGDISRFSAPTNIIHGLHSLRLLGQEAQQLATSRVFFVTDAGVREAGVLDEAFQSLTDAGITFVLYDQAPTDPDTLTVEQIARQITENGCDCVVVAGGGSAMCSGTGAALMATNPGNIRDYAGVERYHYPPLPCIAIPTTAGSGREVSKATVITDEQTNAKLVIIGYTNAPKVAILDPLVLRSLPRGQGVASGVDALTHAIEGYYGRRATLFTDAIALAAIGAIAENICPAILGDDLEAKSRMLLASSMANIACGEAGLGLSHNMNGAITRTYKSRGYPPVAYGLIHAITLPLAMEYNLPACEEKYASLAKVLGVREGGKSRSQLGKEAIARIKELFVALDAPRKLPWENVPPEDIRQLARTVLESVHEYPNPRTHREGEIIELFHQALRGWELG
ncbi:MAG: iron-containing alcohol dehydrogenase [Chloroflexi bacterium]|nr:iron-containing alcohol dehydrogenase [Chloroflexota bacterium]